jgi:molybdopterin molybdotransferase
VQDILLEIGVRRLFYKVRMKPGRPIFAGMQGKRFVLGLPGNPVSCMVTFELFVRPLLDVMLGKKEVGPRRGSACLVEGRKLKSGKRKFLRGRLHETEGRLYVRLSTDQKSGILRSMVEADVLVDVPEKVDKLETGSMVDILYLE